MSNLSDYILQDLGAGSPEYISYSKKVERQLLNLVKKRRIESIMKTPPFEKKNGWRSPFTVFMSHLEGLMEWASENEPRWECAIRGEYNG